MATTKEIIDSDLGEVENSLDEHAHGRVDALADYLGYLDVTMDTGSKIKNPKIFTFAPTRKDYDIGVITRYVIGPTNNLVSAPREVSEADYAQLTRSGSGYYTGASFSWIISPSGLCHLTDNVRIAAMLANENEILRVSRNIPGIYALIDDPLQGYVN